MFFANEQRESVRAENPGITFGMPRSASYRWIFSNESLYDLGQVGKVLGEKWKGLNPKDREPYEAKAREDKERYESEKASYNVSVNISFLID